MNFSSKGETGRVDQSALSRYSPRRQECHMVPTTAPLSLNCHVALLKLRFGSKAEPAIWCTLLDQLTFITAFSLASAGQDVCPSNFFRGAAPYDINALPQEERDSYTEILKRGSARVAEIFESQHVSEVRAAIAEACTAVLQLTYPGFFASLGQGTPYQHTDDLRRELAKVAVAAEPLLGRDAVFAIIFLGIVGGRALASEPTN